MLLAPLFAQSFTTKELATNITTHRVMADELCAGTGCVTEAQLAALLNQTAGAATPTSVPSSPSNIRDLSSHRNP